MAKSDTEVQAASAGAQTLARGLRVVGFLVSEPEPQRPSQIARALDLERSAVYRLLAELASQTWVARDTESGRYSIGSGLIALSARVMRRVDLRRTARPLMERLNQATNETISLHLRQGLNRVAIDAIPSRQAVSHHVEIGEQVPLYEGPSGKAILAFLEPNEAAAIVEGAAATRQQRADLLAVLEGIRRQGYVSLVGDRSPVVAGISAPVFGFDGVRGSLTITGPSDRWNKDAMESQAALLVRTSNELSAALGYRID
jgi:DNA-binding IclR family transcriptional regulator